MTHNIQCQRAIGSRCQCTCLGLQHGGATAVVQLSLAIPVACDTEPPRQSASPADNPVDDLAQWLAANSQVLVGVATLAEHAVRKATSRLSAEERHKLKLDRHLVCGLMVEIATELDRIARLPKILAKDLAERCFPGRHRGPRRLRIKLMRAVVRIVLERILNPCGATSLGDAVTFFRLAAVATCPSIDAHPGVRRLCVMPLAAQAADEEITEVLRRAASQPPHSLDGVKS